MRTSYEGTLAVDLGNTNTVVSFQDEKESNSILVDIPQITRSPGIIPTALWFDENSNISRIGMQAIEMNDLNNTDEFFYINFKRLIGNALEKSQNKYLIPTESGRKFFKVLWRNIPKKFKVKRLVLTAPIDTYKGYRQWLISLCSDLPVEEIALVDEPTAAALGINIPHGSKIMTIDIGGSTIDMNIIQIEGGEGKSSPIAELLKFKGNDVSAISKQKIRCAEIISKIGSKIGGKDIDQWIINYFLKSNQDLRNLKIAEEIKCKLSANDINYETRYPIRLFAKESEGKEYLLSKEIFEKILISNNLINHLNNLLKDLLNEARGNFCKISDLHSIIMVGGGTQIPLIKEWISNKIPEVQIKTPPPIESIALGALAMTPGVKIKDILNKGLSIKLFNRREQKHLWHSIFFRGQTWPTEKPYELILQASKSNQSIFEIIIGESNKEREYDIVFENGLPKLAEKQSEEKIIQWDNPPLKINHKNNCQIGEDCLKLFFTITENADLSVEYFDISQKDLGELKMGECKLGNIF